MTLCPLALAIGCDKCPIVKVCPLKTVLGNKKKLTLVKNDPPKPEEQ